MWINNYELDFESIGSNLGIDSGHGSSYPNTRLGLELEKIRLRMIDNYFDITIVCVSGVVPAHLGRVAVLGERGGGGRGEGETLPHLHLLLHTRSSQWSRLSE